MKVVGIKTTIVSVPRRKGHQTAAFTEYMQSSAAGSKIANSVIIEVFTDDGITGIGEAIAPIEPEVTTAIIESAKPMVLGEDPCNVEIIRQNLFSHYKLYHFNVHMASYAIGGIEMALWDIIGKDCRKPLHKLWGGAFRKKIPFYFGIEVDTPQAMANEAVEGARQGFKTLYFKVGFNPKLDLERLKAVREAVGYGEQVLRVDANQSWSPGAAIKIIDKMEKFDLDFIEQPTTMYNLEGLARVRKCVNVPILAHESSWTFRDALNVVKREAADALTIDPRFDEGFMGARKAAGIAEAAGLPVVTHAMSELGITHCAFLQIIATCPNFLYANQSIYSRLTDDILTGGLMKMRDGCLDLPAGPGIGAEIDHDKLVKYNKYYIDIKKRGFEKLSMEWSPVNLRY